MPIPEIHVPREATIVVAASNSTTPSADYICDGTADEVQINAALGQLAATGGRVILLDGTFVVAAAIVLVDNCVLEGQSFPATSITNDGAVDIIQAGNVTAGVKDLVLDHSGGGTGACIITNHTSCTLYVDNCEITGMPAAVHVIEMTDGYLLLRTCAIQAGDIDLSTNTCTLEIYICSIANGGIDLAGAAQTLNMYYTRLANDGITTAAEAIIHTILLVHVEFNGQNVASAATGATVLAMRNCTTVGILTNAGSGAFTIRESDIASVVTSSTGTIAAVGGNIAACGGATAAITWQTATNHYECVPGMTILDSVGAGRHIFLHPGTYTLTATLAITVSNLTIQGAGRQTIITTATDNLDIITCTGGSGTELTNIILRDFLVRGFETGNKNDEGILWTYVDTSKIINVWMEHNGERGLHLLTCDNNEIENVHTFSNFLDGLMLDTCTFNKLINCISNSNTQRGMNILTSVDTDIVTPTCFNNDSGGSTYSGILIQSSDRSTVVGARCSTNGLHGLYIFRSDYVTVTGGEFNSQNTGDGINITGDGTDNADYNTITGAACTSNGDDGIAVEGGGDANKNTVTSCQLLGNSGTALVDNGTNTQVGHNITV